MSAASSAAAAAAARARRGAANTMTDESEERLSMFNTVTSICSSARACD
jgi:hypothetical protein